MELPPEGGLSFKTTLSKTGAKNVVPITINKIAASREGVSKPALVPNPRKIKPTSPLGIIPKPTTNLFVGLSIMNDHPAAIFPTIATRKRKPATIKADRLSGSKGLITERSIPAPTKHKENCCE